MASGDAVQQIKDRLTIEEVVAPYVELHKAGKNFKGKSPFTNEKTPSFYVSPDRGMYYCFSTSQGGDIFTFVQVMEGVDFKGALKILAEKAGVELVPEDPKKKTERDRQYDVLEAATRFFEERFMASEAARAYVEGRAISRETRARWRVGYAPGPPEGGWRELKSHLEAAGFTQAEMLRAGLIKGADEGKEPYDVFRDRVMFPIFDTSGRVVAYSGRILSKDSEAPKYVNSPETELFVKSDILYGYHRAKDGMRKLDFALVVEGQFDVVLSHQAGYNNAVAVSGTALTPHHVDLVQRLTSRVVLALDNDRAGIAAMKRAAELMLARSMDVKVAVMESGKDPADMIAADVESFRSVIKKSVHVIEHLMNILKNVAKDERTWKLSVRGEVLPLVAAIPNAIDREHFEKVIAGRLDTTKEAIHGEVGKLLERRDVEGVSPDAFSSSFSKESSAPETTEQQEIYAEYVFAAVAYLSRFSEHAAIVDRITKQLRFVLETEYDLWQEKMSDERLNKTLMLFEKTFEGSPNKDFFGNLVSKLNRLTELYLKGRIAEVKVAQRAAEAADTAEEAYAALLVEAQQLNQKLAQHALSEEQLLG